MFLYNMLNNKEETLKNTIRDIEALKKSVMMMASAEEYSRIETESEEAATKESVTVNAIAKVESADEKVSVNKKIKSDIVAPTNNEKEGCYYEKTDCPAVVPRDAHVSPFRLQCYHWRHDRVSQPFPHRAHYACDRAYRTHRP
jgi:hypothetical protein